MSKGQPVTRRVREDIRRTAQCPDCVELIALPTGARKGSRIECPECGAQLEVISLKPPELDYAFEYEDGEDDED